MGANNISTELAIYVLLGWLDEGSNEFGEDFLLFRVFVEIFLTFETFSMFFSTRDEVEGWNEHWKCQKCQKNQDKHERKVKSLTKFIIAKI